MSDTLKKQFLHLRRKYYWIGSAIVTFCGAFWAIDDHLFDKAASKQIGTWIATLLSASTSERAILIYLLALAVLAGGLIIYLIQTLRRERSAAADDTLEERPPIPLAYRCGITDCTIGDTLDDCLLRADIALGLAKERSDGMDDKAVQIVTKRDLLLTPKLREKASRR
jgi:hypothetical protein